MHCNGFYNLGENSQVQKKTKFVICKKMGGFAVCLISCARGTWYVLDIELDKNKNMFLEWE